MYLSTYFKFSFVQFILFIKKKKKLKTNQLININVKMLKLDFQT